MSERHHVFLVPGFFGFDAVGDLAYFAHVRDALEESARARGLPISLHIVATPPTASVRHRAARLLEAMHAALGDEPGPVHLLGHSSGGLDARMVVTPQVSLPTELAVEPVAARVRTVVTVSSPHHGTPVAGFFSSLLGKQMLLVLSVATSYVLRTGRLPLDVLVGLGGFFMAGPLRPGTPSPLLERLYQRLLGDFALGRRGPVEGFLDQIGRDQDLLAQLMPAAMDVFNASTDDRPGVRYGCVVTEVRGRIVRGFLSAGLSPYAHASHALVAGISRIAAFMPADRVPRLSPAQEAKLRAELGTLPSRRHNDGIVPALSQVWGEVIAAVQADHLDVIGHFDHRTHVPPHFDWLTSGSAFSRPAFTRLWERVASYMFPGR